MKTLALITCWVLVLVALTYGLQCSLDKAEKDNVDVCVGWQLVETYSFRWSSYKVSLGGKTLKCDIPIPTMELRRVSVVQTNDGSRYTVPEFLTTDGLGEWVP